MSIKDLKTLHDELPELFQPRDLSPSWDDGLIIVAVDNPEFVGIPQNMEMVDDGISDDGDFLTLESFGSGLVQNLSRIGVPVPEMSPTIVQTLGGAHSGAPVPYTDPNRMPPPESLAFYLPFHYYYPGWWGVYLLFEGVVWLAAEIVGRSGGSVEPSQAFAAARLFLYYHEAFHHKTECFATRLELTHRRPFYKTGFERLYQSTIHTSDCLEEGLANASALADSMKKHRSGAIDQALIGYVEDSPLSYNRGNLIRPQFPAVRCEFAEENQRMCLPHLPSKNPDVWRTTPHMFDGIANIRSRVNYVIPRSSPLVARLPFRPLLPPNKLAQKLKELAGLEFVRHGSNHDIYKTSAGKKLQIPRHARDLGRGLLHKILRQAGLTMGIEEFLQQ